MFTGAAEILSSEDFLIRMTLLNPQLGLPVDDQAKDSLAQVQPSRVNYAVSRGSSKEVLECVRRFASIEGNCHDPNRKGLGRVSADGFPRLGGVLYSEAQERPTAIDVITCAVERTVHAGYLAAALLSNETRKSPDPIDVESLWNRWVPISYSAGPNEADLVFNTCAIEDFWLAVLADIGFEASLAKLESGQPSDLSMSLGGLATTGPGLFLAELLPG